MDEKIITLEGEEVPEEFGKGITVHNPLTLPDLDEAEVTIQVDPKYIRFETPGQKLRGFFCGWGFVMKTIKQVPTRVDTVVIQNKEGFWQNGGAALMSQFRHLAIGVAVEIEYLGEKASLSSGHDVKGFAVRLLNVQPIRVAIASLPPSPPALPAGEKKTESKAPPKVARPLDPETLKSYFPGKIKRHLEKGTITTQAERGILATVLDTTFEGDKTKRHVLTGWLIGREHVKDMSQAEVAALLDWLECRAFGKVPPEYVITEARAAYGVAHNTQPKEGV